MKKKVFILSIMLLVNTSKTAEVPSKADEEVAAHMQVAGTAPKEEMVSEMIEEGPEAMVHVMETAHPEVHELNIERKRQQTIDLVEKGIDFFKRTSLDKACAAFTHTKEFVKGELYLFVYDTKGNCFAHGADAHLLWQNLYDLTDSFDAPIVQMVINKAVEGGGWVTYRWRNATKVSYVQKVKKGDKTYVVGCGYYPFSKSDAVVNLVKGAVALFDKSMKRGNPPSWAFSRISYALGQFRYGDLYLYGLQFNGKIVAQGDRPGLIGTNALQYQDEQGKFVNKEVIEMLKKSGGEGVWIEYFSKNALKRAYAEEVKDNKGNRYFIACGYYPDADRKKTVDLVRRGYQFMKGHGLAQSIDAFTERRANKFRYGDLYVFVYDLKGKVIAHGKDEDLIGQNRWDAKDQDDRYYVRDIIKKAEEGGGWVNAKINNGFQASYVELIDLGIEKYVIGANFFPISKHEAMNLMVESAIGFFETNKRIHAFEEFVKPSGKFVRGDLNLMVFDVQGICYAYGDQYNLIWRNLINLTDDNGRPFVKMMINNARRAGSGVIHVRLNGQEKVIYAKTAVKGDKTYVIGSGYFM